MNDTTHHPISPSELAGVIGGAPCQPIGVRQAASNGLTNASNFVTNLSNAPGITASRYTDLAHTVGDQPASGARKLTATEYEARFAAHPDPLPMNLPMNPLACGT